MMTIVWHGHSCFEIANEATTVVTDPHDGSSIGIKSPNVKADIVLVSHDHYDHNKVKSVEKDTTSVVRKGKKKIQDIAISTHTTYHDKKEGKKRGSNTIFTFTIDGINFCHLGDLGHMLDKKTVEELGKIDILFIPVGGVFTINAEEATKLCEKIKPKVIIPMHYRVAGLSLPIERVDEFLERTQLLYGIRHVANEIEIDHEDIPDDNEVWVFTL